MSELLGKRSRSTGGRAARHAHRKATPTGDLAPVRGGFEGGTYKPLKDSELEKVHETALEILENIGMGDHIKSWTDLVCANGGWVNEHNRLCFPKSMVRDAIAKAGRNFVLHGRDPKHDMYVSGSRVYYTGGSATVQALDINTGDFRQTLLQDLYDYSRLEDVLDNLHFVIRQCIANDLPEAHDLDINTAYAVMSGTSKHIVTSFFQADHLREAVRMYDMSLGGDGQFRERPFAQAIVVVSVSPLKFSPEGCEVLTAAVEEGMPAIMVSVPQSGATSPAALAGHLAQGHAEVLASLTYVNLLKPGHPVLFGNWPFVTDMRSGAFIGGGGEFAVLAAAAAQLGRYLDIPTGIASGMSDSKLPDAQSGWEKGFLTVMPGLAGANLVYEAAGILASVIASSYEAFVIDNDMLGNVLRAIRGIEVNDDTLALGHIREAVEGAGHFLGDAQTLKLMESEYYYPKVADRQNIGGWKETGATDMRERAREVVRKTLSTHFPRHIDDETDARIRANFDIRLDRRMMRSGSGRWYDLK
ncbi:MAG: trimethylamine methyltransferase family protein [Rhodobacteraceae bacterium]|jgi:trimethylamine--corrinoid protein Co-methyltransferase|nr:trimethylamine methyltransferase family protein [Paracoccaceae bacterium]